MGHRIFLAGASGAIGRRLTTLLHQSGHTVFGTTRSAAAADVLRELGAEPIIVDVFDSDALNRAMTAVRPEVVIHQLTDLSMGRDPEKMGEAIVRNARIRREGTENLVKAAIASGATRLVAQSIAWAYRPGAEPHVEDDALDTEAQGTRATSVGGVVALERWTLNSPPLVGVVLRYGQLYGPGTGAETASGASPVHVDAAAFAALLAVDHGRRDVFNIAEPNASVSTEKARRELGWRPEFRMS